VVPVVFKIESEIWGPSPKKFSGPKTSNFRTSRFHRLSPDGNKVSSIGKRRWKLQSFPLHAYQIWWTLVHKRWKIGLWFRPTQSTFSDAHISAHISGAKGRCPLKITQLVEDDQRLLVHTSLGMGLPQQFFNAWNSIICQKSGVLSLIPSGSVGGIAPNFPTWCVPIEA